MSISEKANDLLNKFCGAQYDYVVWSTQDNLVARDKARQEISDRITELEAENIRLGIEYQRMRLALGDIAINSKRALKESPTDHLTAQWRQERQDDKSSNDTQTETFVYGKDNENRDCVLGIRCVNYTLWQGKIL